MSGQVIIGTHNHNVQFAIHFMKSSQRWGHPFKSNLTKWNVHYTCWFFFSEQYCLEFKIPASKKAWGPLLWTKFLVINAALLLPITQPNHMKWYMMWADNSTWAHLFNETGSLVLRLFTVNTKHLSQNDQIKDIVKMIRYHGNTLITHLLWLMSIEYILKSF